MAIGTSTAEDGQLPKSGVKWNLQKKQTLVGKKTIKLSDQRAHLFSLFKRIVFLWPNSWLLVPAQPKTHSYRSRVLNGTFKNKQNQVGKKTVKLSDQGAHFILLIEESSVPMAKLVAIGTSTAEDGQLPKSGVK